MQHKQFNFMQLGTGAAVALALTISAAWAAGITQPSKPDPLLDGGPTTGCAAGADYAEGVDVTGGGVAPADVEARKVPLPDSIAVPIGPRRAPTQANTSAPGRNQNGNPVRPGANPVTLGGDSTYIAIDGRKLEPLVNPVPCASVH